MFSRLRDLLLRLLRVPPEPEPPFGDPASLRVFRASPKHYALRLVGWSFGQLATAVGLVFWIAVLAGAEHEVTRVRTGRMPPGRQELLQRLQRHGPVRALTQVVTGTPDWVINLIWLLKLLGVAAFFGQMALSYAALRLDYELRWYLVTDRSLRLRTGLWQVQEMTMSFANLQQVVVSQGPVQRLLGIADVRVQSAGGGGSQHPHGHHRESLHTGVFQNVDHAPEIRDLILARLRQFRETGLGDPDESPETAGPAAATMRACDSETLAAARELLTEARDLTRSWSERNAR